MRWWTSDTHFGHESVLGFGRQRWASIADHDRELIDNWNDVVGADDEVWHLGDVAWGFPRLVEVLPLLKGRITLVAGNHDSWWPHHRRGFFADESLNRGWTCSPTTSPTRCARWPIGGAAATRSPGCGRWA